MEENKTWLKKSHKLLDQNLALIVLVPTVLGSVWQIFQIGRLNLSYLRFFSLSQAAVDGVLILSLLFVLYLVVSFLRQMYYKMNVSFSISPFILKEVKESEFDLFTSLGLYFILLLYLLTGIEFFYPLFKEQFVIKTIDTIFLFLIISMFLYILIRSNIINFILYLIDRKVITYQQLEERIVPNLTLKTEKILSIRVLTFFMLLVPVIKILSMPLIFISDEMAVPFNTLNVAHVESTIEKELGNKLFRVRYFNDNYLFVEICKNEFCNHVINGKYLPPKYIIYKTDDILFKELTDE